jgi:proton glutamate symport protein
VILGVDAVMDMARTSVNLVGNCLATVVMARWEGDFHPGAPPEPVAIAPDLATTGHLVEQQTPADLAR